LRHQPTDEALALSGRCLMGGSVDLQPDGRTLVIRQPAGFRIVPLLRGFDHPAVAVRLRAAGQAVRNRSASRRATQLEGARRAPARRRVQSYTCSGPGSRFTRATVA
jgi:hypothetical protein